MRGGFFLVNSSKNRPEGDYPLPVGLKRASEDRMAEEKKPDISRRNFLVAASGAIGAVGLGFAAVPFVRSMSPTKDLLAAGVMEVDISDVPEGGFKNIIWRKQPVFILRRTTRMIRTAEETDPSTLADPAAPEERAKRPDLLVCIGICTHLGCIPKLRDKLPDFDQAGFYCPCHGGQYDTLGRRLGGPPPENLHLVPYKVESDNRLVIGTRTFAGFSSNIRKIEKLPEVS